MGSFWRGEFLWHGTSIGQPWLERFYTLSSCAAFAAAVWPRKKVAPVEREAAMAGLAALAFLALELIYISVRFDFGPTEYPSRAMPFLYSGRLALGAMIPVLALYLIGLKRLAQAAGAKRAWLAPATVCLVLLYADIAPAFVVRGSRYNWFHLPSDNDYTLTLHEVEARSNGESAGRPKDPGLWSASQAH